MGWWDTENGVLGDEPADMVGDALLELASARSDLTLASLRDGLELALRTLPEHTLADQERLVGSQLVVQPEPAGVPATEPASPERLQALVRALSSVWARAVGRVPSLGEVLDAFAFVLCASTERYVPGQPGATLRRLSLAPADAAAGPGFDDVLARAARTGRATTAGTWLDRARLERLLAVPELEELDVAADTLAEDAWPALAAARLLRVLRLEAVRPGEPPWDWLGHMTGLEELDLAYADVDDAIVVQIRKLRGLRALDVGGTPLRDEAFAELDLSQLDDFRARGTALGDRTAVALAVSAPLRCADFDRTVLSDVGLAALSRIPMLRELAIERSAVTPLGLVILADFPALAVLSLGTRGVPPERLGVLSGAPELTTLTLWDATPEHVRALASCSRLRSLVLVGSEVTPALVEALGSLPTLRVLDVGGSVVDEHGVELLRGLERIEALSPS